MPGTTGAWPNWSLALPVPLEEALSDPRVLAVVRILAEREPGSASTQRDVGTGGAGHGGSGF